MLEISDKNLNNKTLYFIRKKNPFLPFYAMHRLREIGYVIRMSNIVQVTAKPCIFPLPRKKKIYPTLRDVIDLKIAKIHLTISAFDLSNFDMKRQTYRVPLHKYDSSYQQL